MNEKIIVIILSTLSLISTILWLIALITANITIFTVSLVMVIINLLITFKKFKTIKEYFNSDIFCGGRFKEDERTNFIDDKASTATLGISLATIIYIAVGILTLRNICPDFLMAGYTLVATVIFILIIHVITTNYYKHKY